MYANTEAVKIATRAPDKRQAVTKITSITTGQGVPFRASVRVSSTTRTIVTIPSKKSPPTTAARSIWLSIQLAKRENNVPLSFPRMNSEIRRSGKLSRRVSDEFIVNL